MAYALKPICCTFVEVVARDTARLRVKVSVGFAAREGSRVHRMSPGALSKVNTRELLPAEDGAFSLPISSLPPSRLYLSVYLWNINFAFRTAYVREKPEMRPRRRYFGDNSRGGCFRSCCELTLGNESCCTGMISPNSTRGILLE